MNINKKYTIFFVIVILISVYYFVQLIDSAIENYALKMINTESAATKITLRHFAQPEENIFSPVYFNKFLENIIKHKSGLLAYKSFYIILIILYLAFSIAILFLLFPIKNISFKGKRFISENRNTIMQNQGKKRIDKKVVRNTTYMLCARVINGLFVLLLFVFVSRELGTRLFGTYSFLHAIVLTGTIFANFGFDVLMVREVAKDNALGKTYLSNILGLKFITSCITWGIFTVMFSLISDDYTKRLFWVYASTIVFNSLSQAFWYYGDSFEKLGYHSLLWIISNCLKTITGVTILFCTKQMKIFIYGLVFTEFISLMISFFVIILRFGRVNISFDIPMYWVLFKKAYPIGIGIILGVLYFRIDIVMLGLMKDQQNVAWYSAPWKIIEGFTILPGSIILSTFPVLSKNFNISKTIYWLNVKQALAVLFLAGLIIASGLFYLAEYIIILIYGPEFLSSIPVFKLFSIVLFFLFINWFLAYVLVSSGKEKYNTICLLIITVLNIMLNLFLIPKYGHIGAACATLTSEIILIILYGFCVVRLNKENMIEVKFSC